MTYPTSTSYPTSRSSTGRTMAILAGATVLIAALVIGVLAALGGSTVKQETDTAVAAEVRAALASATVAEHAYATVNGTFIPDQQALLTSGFTPVPGVDVRVVNATADTFCLAGGPAGQEPILWATDQGRTVAQPCR